MPAKIPALAVVALTAALAACGGGGGGAVVRPEVPFSSFGARQPNTTVVMSGNSMTASGTETTTQITSVNMAPEDTASSVLKLTYDAHLGLIGLSISTPQSSVSYSASHADTILCSGGACIAGNATSSAVVIDAPFVGWDYQTFGVWGMAVTPMSYQMGAISAGSITPGIAVPTSGPNALFTGLATGFMTDSDGFVFSTAADMSANVNWTTRTIQFSTSNTVKVDAINLIPTNDSGYNLSGTLMYNPDTSLFTGNVQAQNVVYTNLLGNATGRFYGPNAEEIGGVYSLRGSGLNSMLGGFGGKR